jgi:hypothetical protein
MKLIYLHFLSFLFSFKKKVPANFKKDKDEDDEDNEEPEEEEEEIDPETHIKNVKEAAKAFGDSGAFVFNDEKGFMPLKDGLNEILKEETGEGLEEEEEEEEEDDKKKSKKDKKEKKGDESEDKKLNAQEASAAVPTAAPAAGGASAAPSVKASVSTGVSISFPSPSSSGNIPKFGVGSGKGAASSMGGRPTNGARIVSPKSSGNTVRASIGATVGVIAFAAYSLL